VTVDGVVVRSYELCGDHSMTGFARAVIDLSDYAGQTVTLGFSIVTDESLVSSFFVDDVSFVSSAASVEASAAGAPTSAAPRARE
jgi:bacillopeptidase F (M6 metalloprotease family)